jgi:predicted glycoside hydrolase/deacetylase ChbG (UPF0249 family)
VIVNADDFGRSAGINGGVAEAHERGIVTSASLMVRWPAAAEAAAYARRRPELSVGLHVDLGEWAQTAAGWQLVYERIDAPYGTEDEVRAQLELFRDLVGGEPTHLDSHQHVHRTEPARSAIAQLAAELCIPARELTSYAIYCGDFYGQSASGVPFPEALTSAALIELLRTCGPGVTEVGCHPAAWLDFESAYRAERLMELDVLCSHEVHSLFARGEVELISFRDTVVPLGAR